MKAVVGGAKRNVVGAQVTVETLMKVAPRPDEE
jgi:hypothetical protein